jgi:RES domain-containing protein
MIVYRISACKNISQLNGYGAFLNGGRWNSKDRFMLYASCSPALALVETLAHFSIHNSPDNYCILMLDVPDYLISEFPKDKLPSDWQVSPSPYSLKKIGDSFLNQQQFVGLKVPSAIIEYDFNLLLNPMHPTFHQIKITQQSTFNLDKRVLKKT